MINDEVKNEVARVLGNKYMSKEEKRAILEKLYPGAMDKIKDVLNLIGDDSDREGLLDTPYRVVKSWLELYSGYHEEPEKLLNVKFEEDMEDTNEIVICRNITFQSMCEHHVLPFIGVCHIGYLPNKKVVGLSKLARLVEAYGRRLQIQEKLTNQIANALQEHLNPRGVGVVIKAKHLCMSHRGVKNPTSEMVTSCMLGAFKDQQQTRAEFLSLIKD